MKYIMDIQTLYLKNCVCPPPHAPITGGPLQKSFLPPCMLATYDLRFQHHGASHYGQVCLVFVKFLYICTSGILL